MNPRFKIIIFISFTIILSFIVSNSIGFAGDMADVQQKKDSSIQNNELVNQLEKKSSVNQVNVQKYFYRYYPSCSVYYDINRSLYYYLEDDNWGISNSLPNNLERKLGDYVKIEMDKGEPYLDHDKHVKKFPPKDSRKTKNNFWSKLMFVLLYGNASRSH